MADIQVLIDSESLVVVGGPQTIELTTDKGARGIRGSQILVNVGIPGPSTFPDALVNDLCIDVNPGSDFSWLYQYQQKPAGKTWERILKISPSLYHAVYPVTFTAGAATIAIPITDITPTTMTLTEDNFAVGFAFYGANPIAGSLVSRTIVGADLELEFTAAEFDVTWAALAGATDVFVTIRVVPV
jgi:hypothetical protein